MEKNGKSQQFSKLSTENSRIDMKFCYMCAFIFLGKHLIEERDVLLRQKNGTREKQHIKCRSIKSVQRRRRRHHRQERICDKREFKYFIGSLSHV